MPEHMPKLFEANALTVLIAPEITAAIRAKIRPRGAPAKRQTSLCDLISGPQTDKVCHFVRAKRIVGNARPTQKQMRDRKNAAKRMPVVAAKNLPTMLLCLS